MVRANVRMDFALDQIGDGSKSAAKSRHGNLGSGFVGMVEDRIAFPLQVDSPSVPEGNAVADFLGSNRCYTSTTRKRVNFNRHPKHTRWRFVLVSPCFRTNLALSS